MGTICHKAMVIHLPEQLASGGPPWPFSTLFYEGCGIGYRGGAHNMCIQKQQWLSLPACKCGPQWFSQCLLYTFDRDSNAVALPAHVQEAGVPNTQLSDAQQMQLLS